MIKLSIIIPLYNVEPYIVQCLESIHNQQISPTEHEIIIIDDGSTDNSYKIAKDIANNHENIQIYQQENSGLSATRNRGMTLAKGRYIFFVDSDDYIAYDSLHEVLNCVLENDLDILEFDWIRSEKRNLISSKKPNKDTKLDVLVGKKYIESKWIHDSVCTSFYKNSFLQKHKVRFKVGKLMEDMMFNAELIPQAKRIAYYPYDIYRYVINPNSIWTTTESSAMRKSINDFTYMTMEFSALSENLKNQGIKTEILNSKIQLMLFNTFKRILKSDLSFKEITQIINSLKAAHLYPLNEYKGSGNYRGPMTKLFNNKYLLYISKVGFNLLKKPIDYFVIRKYKSNKEKKIVAP